MLRKGRKGNNSSSAASGGAAPSRSALREVSIQQALAALPPAASRANLLYQCYDTSCTPSNAMFLSPSNAGGGDKQRPVGMTGALAAGAAAGKANHVRRGVSIAGFNGAQGHSSAQATALTRVTKQQQQQQQPGSNGARGPPLPPAPVARGGESYANENKRLAISDPLPYSARQRQKDGNGGGGVNGYTTAHRKVVGTTRGGGEPHDTPDLNARRGSDSALYSETDTGRRRALSLPRTHEDVKEILPRLRPLREVGHSGSLSRLCSPPPRLLADHHDTATGDTLNTLRTIVGNSSMCVDDREKEKQREVLSAPPTSSTIIPSSYSPRPVGDQLRLLRRHSSQGSARGNNGMATRAAGGLFTLESVAGGTGDTSTASIETRRNVKRGAAAVAAAAVAQRGIGEMDSKSADDCSRTNVRRAPHSVEAEQRGRNDGETRGEASDSDKLFGSTQTLFSLRSGAERGNAMNAGAQPTPPPAPATVPSSRTRNRANSGPGGAESELPVYKFNVVLSSGRTTTVPISLIVGSGCVQGMRPTMEDAHFAVLNAAHVRGQPVSLLAVLDGHCGRRVADLGAKWLPHYVLHHAALGENNALALVESILQTDREIFHTLQAKSQLNEQHKAGRGIGRRRHDVEEEMFDEMASGTNGGSTLIAAAVCGRMLYVACLGDARAVLYDGHTTIAMSEDHKPGNTTESRRIAKCGGFVQFGRVCGILAVSRALGDFEFKFQPSSALDGKGEEKLSTNFPFGVLRDSDLKGSAAPPSPSHCRRFISNRDLMVSNIADVRQLHLTDASAFLLLACDGLWDVLSNEEATEFVRDFLCYTPDVCDPHILSGVKSRPSPDVVQRVLNNCCQKLAEFAVDRGSMDNVSVMVLFFHDVVDTVARFSGRVPSPARVGEGSSSASHQPHSLRDLGRSNSRNSAPSAFQLTNSQLKVRNGRIVAQR
ncbi:Protein phosphatase 2C, putative [Leishmania shawi]|uniref:PPM-type phosphatase domain-containing protein n=1 Tax=Leishmania shawi TaxID=5680 RepID=A0ABR3EBJ7_9TRYP